MLPQNGDLLFVEQTTELFAKLLAPPLEEIELRPQLILTN